MTQPNPFDEYLNGIGPNEQDVVPSCQVIHPIVDEYMGLLTEDLMKLDREDFGEALKKRLNPAELQMIECLTREVMFIFDAQISDSEDDALNLILSTGADEELDDDDDSKAKLFEGPKPEPKNFPEDDMADDDDAAWLASHSIGPDDDEEDGTPLLIPTYGLESMIRRALCIGYLIMPDIASHL